MKIVFMGTPDFAVPVLEALSKEHEVVCVYTRAPKEAGRGQKESKTPVHLFAERHGIEVRTPKSLRNAEEQENFKILGADAAVVAAYGLILPKEVLEAYPLGCINVHASMLPRWRGAAPIQRAILAGDEVSGVTIMQMDEGLDTGNILLEDKRPVPLANITGGELHDRLAGHGAEMIVEYLRNPAAYPPRRQGEMTTPYAAKLEKSEAKIDFSEPADAVARKIRAFNPFPGAYFEFNGERFKILEADFDMSVGNEPGRLEDSATGGVLAIACGKGIILPAKIQRQGKKPMEIGEFLRGFSFPSGTVLK